MKDEGRRGLLQALSLGSSAAAGGLLLGCGGGQEEAARTSDGSARLSERLRDGRALGDEIRQSLERLGAATSFNVDERLMSLKASTVVMRRRSVSEGLLSQRMQLASDLGAQTEELAFTNGASVGLTHALTGMAWRAGDAVIHTDHEHPNTLAVLRSIQQFYGVALVEARLPRGPHLNSEAIVNEVEAAILDARGRGWTPRLLVWSSPTYQTGVMIPVARMTSLARRHGLMTVCDGAHLLGMMAFQFSALDLDVLVLSGHKWQCGPPLTGILLTRASAGQPEPAPPAWHPLLTMTGGDGQPYDVELLDVEMQRLVRSISRRFEALSAACEWWGGIGRPRIEARLLALTRYLRRRIVDTWGEASVMSPMGDPELLSAITAFDPFVGSALQASERTYMRFVERMRNDHAFVVRLVALPRRREEIPCWAIRICTPVWIDEEDVDDLVDAMRRLTAAMSDKGASGL